MDERNSSNPYGPTSVIEPNNVGTVKDAPIQSPSPVVTEMYTGPSANSTNYGTNSPLKDQVEQISSPYESLDGGPEVTTSLVSAPTVRGNSSSPTGSTTPVDANQTKAPVFRDKDTNKLLFRLIAGATVVFFVLFGAGMISSRLSNNRPVDPVAQLEEQEIRGLTDQQSTLGVQTSGSTLLVNGNVLATDSLQVSSGGVIGSIVLNEGSDSQTYTLPNSSGVFCLDSNNCNYLQSDDVITTSIGGSNGALSLGDGLTIDGSTIVNTLVQTSLNGSSGSIIIQGTTNQVGVSKNGNTITLTSPQDIGLTSSPTFSSITLSGIGTQNGNVICDFSNNCGYSGVNSSFVQGGNSFGLAAVLGTNDNFSLAFETNGATQATLAVGGAFTMQNSTDSTSAFRVMDTDGGNPVLNVDTSNERVGIGTAAPSVELDVVGDTVISDRLQVGPTGDSIDECTSIFFGALGCDVAIDVVNTSTDPNTAVYGINNNTSITPTGTNIATNYGSANNLFLGGVNNFSSANIGVSGSVIATNSAGTVARIIGVDATAAMLTTNSTATVTEAIGLQTGVGVFSTGSGGTITTGYGLQVNSASLSGAGASIGTNYGIYVNPQTNGTTDYGVAIGAADTQTLWLSSNADNTSASAGIAFGSSADTNLYRSAANTLRTDDALSVGDDITVTGDILPSADDTYDLGSNSNRWRDLYLGPATLSIGTSTADYKISYDTGGNSLLFNNDQADRDFRIAGVTQANLLYVDAGNNRIGIGTNTPGYELDVVGNLNASTSLYVGGTQVCTVGGCTAASGSGNYIQNGTAQQTANFNIQSAGAASIGAVVRGATSQTAALQEWQSSAGTVLARITASGWMQFDSGKGITGTAGDGNLYIGDSARAGGAGGKNLYYGSAYYGGYGHEFFGGSATNMLGVMLITSSQASKIGLTVRGAASQSGDLQQWQNSSGTRLTSIESTGSLYSPTAPIKLGYNVELQGEYSTGGGFVNLIKRGSGNDVTVGNTTSDTKIYANTYLDLTNSGGNGLRISSYNVNKYSSIGYLGSASAFWNALWLQPVNSTSVAGTIRAQAGQIANLVEWQDSAGTVKSAIAADGDFVSTEQISIGTLTPITGVRLSVYTATGTAKGLVVRASGSQTANLQEWQSSAGTALAHVNASGQLTATGLVSTQSGSTRDLYFNRSDTGAVRIQSNWGSATAYGVQIQPSAGSITSYANGYGVIIGNVYSSSVTSGNYDILRVYDNAFSPASGSSQLSGININPVINQTGTATGITRGLYVNPTLTSAVDFRGVEIANASGFGLYQSGASAKNYLAGNLGIGTTSAQAKLHISQTGISSSGQEALRLSGEVIAATPGSGPKILFTAADGTTPVASLQAYTFGASDVGLALGTGYNNVTNKLFINNAGNVGIGTSSPSSALEIVRGTGGAETKVLDLRSGTIAANTSTTLKFTNSDTVGSNIGSAITSIRTNAVSNGDSDLIFKTSEGFSLLQGMVLKSNGNVGIGTSSPTNAKLEVIANSTAPAVLGTGLPGTAGAIGVKGTGYDYGVYGSNSRIGVYGTGTIYGVQGLSGAASGAGVYAWGGNRGNEYGLYARNGKYSAYIEQTQASESGGSTLYVNANYSAITTPAAIINQEGTGDILSLRDAGSTVLTVKDGGNVGINNSSAPNRLTINTATTADSTAQLLLSTSGTANKGLVVQGVVSQTANLQEWQSSAGTVLSSINASGSFVNNGGAAGLSFGANNRTNLSAGGVVTFTSIRTSGDQYTALGDSSQESMAIQSNGIFFANGGSTLMNILSATGNVGINDASAPNRLTINAATTADSSAQLLLSTNGTTNKGVVVQGVVSQTANLQEWQSSAGTVLASINPDGDLEVVDATVNGNLVVDGTATFNGNITVNGHVITGNTSGTTTAAAGASAGAGASASITGNDTSGKVTITTGTGSGVGAQATVTFANAYGAAPRVTLTPADGDGASIQYYAGSGTTTFTINSNNAPTDATVYEYYYQIME